MCRAWGATSGTAPHLAPAYWPARPYCRSKTKLSVTVSGEDSPGLASRLAAAQRRAEAAELELARAAAAAGKAAAAPAAETRRLHAALEASQAEVDMLRSRLAAHDRKRSLSQPASHAARPQRCGLAAELDEADDGRAAQLEAQVASLQGKLAAAEARCAQLEQQLRDARQQRGRAESAAPGAAAAAEEAAWEREVAQLTEEKAALQKKCRQLRLQAAEKAVQVEQLMQRLRQHGPGSTQRQPAPAAPAGPAHTGGSPAAAVRPGSAPCVQRRPGSPAARPVAYSPSEAAKQQFRAEMQHTLRTVGKPGVVSRYPHSLASFLELRADLKA